MLPFLKNNKTTGFTDQPAQVDLFDIDDYVKCLTSFVELCNTPITISIQGTWGSGKTSFMTLVKDRLPHDKVSVIWYNTWQFSQFDREKNLATSLMTVLMNSMAEAGGVKSENALKFATLLKNAAFTATSVAVDTLVGGKAADLVGSLAANKEIDDNLKLVTSIQQLKDQFQNMINEHLAKTGKDRVVIFVDDLDRLDPVRAVELLEVLKLFLDCERCVFVLAIDYDVVCRGVAAKYNFSDDEMDKGRSFFDKIIQVPFKLPIASYALHRYIKQCLSDIGIEVKDEEIDTYESLIRTSQGTNPRSMKRLFNAFLLLNIMTNIKSLDVDSKLLFAALCLQFLNDDIYNFFVANVLDLSEQDLSNLLSGDFSRCESLFEENEADIDEEEYADCASFFGVMLKIISPEGKEVISTERLDSFKSAMSLTATTSSSNVEVKPAKKKSFTIDRSKAYRFADKIFYTRSPFFHAGVQRYVEEHPGITYLELQKVFEYPGLPPKIKSIEDLNANYSRSAIVHQWYRKVSTVDCDDIRTCSQWPEGATPILIELFKRVGFDVELIDNPKKRKNVNPEG